MNDGAIASSGGRVRTRRARTRAGLLRAAHDLMSRQGVDATTIQQVTDAADVGFGTFYNYFASKDDIAAKVLDCVINSLGSRNDLANAGETDPVRVSATSVRLVAREMLTDPMWRWWVRRPDLLVGRMRAGFAPFGIRDLVAAVAAGRYRIPGTPETSWSFLIWLLAGGIKDIMEANQPPGDADEIAEAVLRVMGVGHPEANAMAHLALPPLPALPVDYGFQLA